VREVLTPEVVAEFSGEGRFEAAMVRFSDGHSAIVGWMLKDMAKFFAKFRPGHGNRFTTLLASLGSNVRSCVLATTNYDLLLEYALGANGFSSVMAYPPPPGAVCLRKLHGSCNFLPAIDTSLWTNVNLASPYGRPNLIIENGCDIRLAKSTEEITQFCESSNSLPPAIAVYGPGKPALTGVRTIARLQKSFAEAVACASSVIVVGLRVNEEDQHIWGPLAATDAPLFYVAPDRERFEKWAERRGQTKAKWLCARFEDALEPIADLVGNALR
jgi:hypothetical protein